MTFLFITPSRDIIQLCLHKLADRHCSQPQQTGPSRLCTALVAMLLQAEKQRAVDAEKEKQLEARTKYKERTKTLLVFKDTFEDDKPVKKGKVALAAPYCAILVLYITVSDVVLACRKVRKMTLWMTLVVRKRNDHRRRKRRKSRLKLVKEVKRRKELRRGISELD